MCSPAQSPTWAELVALVQAKVAAGPSSGSAETLIELEAMVTAEAVLLAGQAAWLAHAHDTEATVEECGRSARSWLVEEMRLNPGEAARRMRLAKGLPDA